MRSTPLVKLAVLPLALLTLFAGHTPSALAQNAGRIFASATLHGGYMEVRTSDGVYLIKPYTRSIIETTFIPDGETADPASHAVVLAPAAVSTSFSDKANKIEYATPGLVVTVTKSPFQISYAYKGKQLVAEKRGYMKVTDAGASTTACEAGSAASPSGMKVVSMMLRV